MNDKEYLKNYIFGWREEIHKNSIKSPYHDPHTFQPDYCNSILCYQMTMVLKKLENYKEKDK